MVNADLLTQHASNYKLTKDNAAEYFVQLFTKHPELAEHWNADGIDPDSLAKAQRFIMLGMQEMQLFFRLPKTIADERQWRSALSGVKESFGDNDCSLKEFNKVSDAFLAAMEKHAGGVTAEQKKEWNSLFDKAYADMKTWGWY
ncbi:unnamed protein product [Caenorhabditis auriculariae]|uniref:Globin domain-containing protein n=1 Tax=Caenorhabditis auriculariae TaxID=2777116 RepID=A0A8S1HEY0_9PELO|nr:unnamed protein product [Caenorhabditis auriculariae]